MDFTQAIAMGGTTGGVAVVCFMVYKLCQKSKFHSKCCGGELDISPQQEQTNITVNTPTPSPALTGKVETGSSVPGAISI